jgi:hypothetical protein
MSTSSLRRRVRKLEQVANPEVVQLHWAEAVLYVASKHHGDGSYAARVDAEVAAGRLSWDAVNELVARSIHRPPGVPALPS